LNCAGRLHRSSITTKLHKRQRAQLESLAKATNLSSADLTRLAIDRLLENVKLPTAQEAR
jgi:hypothetical protein